MLPLGRDGKRDGMAMSPLPIASMPDKSAAVTLGRGERAGLAGSSGTTTTRIGALSQRPFDACWLCNRDAVEPLRYVPSGRPFQTVQECI